MTIRIDTTVKVKIPRIFDKRPFIPRWLYWLSDPKNWWWRLIAKEAGKR